MTTAEKKITCKNYDSALLGAHISGKNKESMEISIINAEKERERDKDPEDRAVERLEVVGPHDVSPRIKAPMSI